MSELDKNGNTREPTTTETHSVEPRSLVSEEESTLSIIASRISGGDIANLDKEQIDRLIEQRGEVYEYIHKDNKQNSFDGKYYFTGVCLIVIALVALVVYKVPEYTTEVVSLLIGLLGGYGFGKLKTN